MWKVMPKDYVVVERKTFNPSIARIRQLIVLQFFVAFAIEDLGMPANAKPLYDSSPRRHRKASRINAYILEVGSSGHNRAPSYTHRTTYLSRKTLSFRYRLTASSATWPSFHVFRRRFFEGRWWLGLRR